MPSSWVSVPPGPGRNWRGTILCLHPSLPPTSLRAEPGPPWWYPRPRSSVPAGAAPRWTGTNFCSTLPTSPERLVTRCPPAARSRNTTFPNRLGVSGPRSELDRRPGSCVQEKSGKSWVKLVEQVVPPAAAAAAVGRGLAVGTGLALRTALGAPLLCAPLLSLSAPSEGCTSRGGLRTAGRRPRRKRDERRFKIKAQRLQKLANCVVFAKGLWAEAERFTKEIKVEL